MSLNSPQAVLADVLMGGTLTENLRLWRASGDSFEVIARRLWSATGEKVMVSRQTVANWCEGLDPEEAS